LFVPANTGGGQNNGADMDGTGGCLSDVLVEVPVVLLELFS
jgi:hypothetical protein